MEWVAGQIYPVMETAWAPPPCPDAMAVTPGTAVLCLPGHLFSLCVCPVGLVSGLASDQPQPCSLAVA